MTFEPSECKALTNSRKRNPTRVDLFFGSTKLAEKNELELLGVTVDCKLIWTKHVSSIDARAGQKLGALRKVAHKLTRERRATVYKAQVRCVMECASLCWMSPSSSTVKLFDSIQSKALQIIGVNDQQARSDRNIPLLHHRRLVAAASMLYKMHRSKCPADLKALLPQPYVFRRSTRSSLSMPSHALSLPVSRTHSTDRTFIHTAVKTWNELPDNVVGVINFEGS